MAFIENSIRQISTRVKYINYIIFDLEASCWEGDASKLHTNEIIEIGAVLIDEQKQIKSQFNKFIKPMQEPILSDFCKKLTSISQKDIDNAKNIAKIFIKHFDFWQFKK